MAEFIVSLKHQNVFDILQQLTFSESPFLLVETMDIEQARPVLGRETYVRLYIHDDARYDVNAYSSGRVFDSTGELKWQKEDEGFHIVYIGKEDQAKKLKAFKPDAGEPDELPQHRETSIYLWGRKVSKERIQHEMHFEKNEEMSLENIFLELQAPQYLSYPVEAVDNARVRMQTREYNDPKTGSLQYYRFVTVISTK